MNNTPVIRNGVIIRSEALFPENDLKKIAAAKNAIRNNIPPINSHFQAIIK